MTQMDIIHFARWKELGLPEISLQVNIHIRTEISSQNNSIKFGLISLEGLIDGGKPQKKQIPRR